MHDVWALSLPIPPVLPVEHGYPEEGPLAQTCRPSISCCSEIVFRFLLGRSRRPSHHQVYDQEHDSNHE